MVNMPMPTGLTLLIMIGNEAAQLAGSIVTSVADHADKDSRDAITCYALVDENFQKENAVVDNVFYSYTKETLTRRAIEIGIPKIDEMVMDLSRKGVAHIPLNQVHCVFIVDPRDDVTLKQIGTIVDALQIEMNNRSNRCDMFLCLLADYRTSGRNRAWLMKGDTLREEMDKFCKVLLLSNKDIHGGLGEIVNLNREAAVMPALLLMMGGHELNDPNRLYTAAYSKTGGTTNDILELKQHIAAETLDRYFSKTNEITTPQVWEFLSTPEIDLTKGKSTEERISNAAEAWLPSLECIAATADLEDKDFDPVAHVMAFDELNCSAMYEGGELTKNWLDTVQEKIREYTFLDALKLQLDEDGDLFREILQNYQALLKARKSLSDPRFVQPQLGAADIKKGLFTQRRDYNLKLLSIIVNNYHQVCKRRYALKIAACLQLQIPVVREKMQMLIDGRKRMLKQLQQAESKIDVLRNEKMCGRAAEMIQSHYTQKPVEQLNVFLSHQEDLYQQGSEKYWRDLAREFRDTCKITNNFSSAFLQGKDVYGLQSSVQELAQNLYPLIPDYPDELGALPQPTGSFLLNEGIAKHLESMPGWVVYGVPGDILEYVSLYRLGTDLSVLKDFKLFAEGVQIGDFGAVYALPQRKSDTRQQKDTVEARNPWNVTIKELSNGGVQLAWNFADQKATYDIYVDNELVVAHYDYKTHAGNGMVYMIPAGSVHGPTMKIRLDCGERSYSEEISIEGTTNCEQVSLGKTHATWQGCELVRCIVDTESDLQGKCLLIHEKGQVYRARIPIMAAGQIGPLWLPEGTMEIELGEIS